MRNLKDNIEGVVSTDYKSQVESTKSKTYKSKTYNYKHEQWLTEGLSSWPRKEMARNKGSTSYQSQM